MDKPTSMIIDDFKKELVDVINNSRLHPAILEMIVSAIAREVHDFAIKQCEEEKMEYEQSLQVVNEKIIS